MSIPTDPRLSTDFSPEDQQWYLNQRYPSRFDLRVMDAWADYTGAGVDVFVIDDGFDYNHTDLSANYDETMDYDYSNDTTDAFGASSDAHGTAVMGIIGADDNGQGTVGIAFDANLVGYRTVARSSDTRLENTRDGIRDAANAGADVINVSLNQDGMATIFGGSLTPSLVLSVRTSINFAVETGRDGLGTIIVKSAGNGRGGDYDVNANMWTNDTRQIVVAAVDQNGSVSSYSSYGAANLVSGFGSPSEVVTTDRTGSAGYDATDITNRFHGTDAAAAMVSGVVALVLDANADLGWRDVQTILAVSARFSDAPGVGSQHEPVSWNGGDNWNGGRMHFSIDYGYGLVDATAAVRLAESWLLGAAAQTSANQVMTLQDGLNSTVTIPDGNSTGRTFTIREADAIEVERVSLTVTFATTYVGDVKIVLTSPDGTRSTLVNGTGTSQDFNGTWTFESQAFRGVSSAGAWMVSVVDAASGNTLTVSDLKLRTFGSASSANDRYIFTNEYSDFAGLGAHATLIIDRNGGIDIINASAVTSASLIDLNDDAQSRIDGVNVNFQGMERAIGGDGSDTFHGNSGANHFYGFRGNDLLIGRAGNDLLSGQAGDDRLFGGLGNDRMVGGAGTDKFVFNTALNGSTNVDTIDDFSVVSDFAMLDNAIFSRIGAPGTLASAAFRKNATGLAGDASDRIIYETDTGNLFYDLNGTGSGGRVRIAHLDAGLALTHQDFLIF